MTAEAPGATMVPMTKAKAVAANENALSKVEASLPDFSGRTLVDSSEIVDLLLDLRQLLIESQN